MWYYRDHAGDGRGCLPLPPGGHFLLRIVLPGGGAAELPTDMMPLGIRPCGGGDLLIGPFRPA